MKISIIIPVYNESAIIEKNACLISECLENNFEDYELIFSDDGSTDGSAGILKGLNLPNCRIEESMKNMGKGHAVRSGMAVAKGDILIFTDADLAYGTDAVLRMANALREGGADVVIGSRNIDDDGYSGYPKIRKRASKIYISLLAWLFGLKHSDFQCGLKGFRKEAAERIFSNATVNGFAFDIELLLISDALGIKTEELPVRIQIHVESKVSLIRDALKMLADLVKIKFRLKKTLR